MNSSSERQRAEEVLKANIELHTQLAKDYSQSEPHFKPENIAHVTGAISKLLPRLPGQERMLDLGCGTGFMINIGKRFFKKVDGVDATQAMLDQVDKNGGAEVRLFRQDTAKFQEDAGSYDLVTAYSFLHHLFDVRGTIETAHRSLKKGGAFFVDLEPNASFWREVARVEPGYATDSALKSEITKLQTQEEEVATQLGIKPELLRDAEYGKSVQGGFDDEFLRDQLKRAGFERVEIHYYWYLGQAQFVRGEETRLATQVDEFLRRGLPLSRYLYKYIGFTAFKA